MTLFGDVDGKLRVRRQVEDYAYRSVEFEMMGFLSFIVETYERRMKVEMTSMERDHEEEGGWLSGNEKGRYLDGHSRSATHIRVGRPDGHNMLPNVVGPWLPRRNGDESTRSFYFAAMLSFLKPWRNLKDLKRNDDSWEAAFEMYMGTTNQRDKDVVAGCQYYYDTRSAMEEDKVDEDDEMHVAGEANDGGIEVECDETVVEEGIVSSVSDRSDS